MAQESLADLKRLQTSLIMLVAAIAIGAAAVVMALKYFDAATKATAQALIAQKEIRGKLSKVNDEEQELREKLERYQAMDAKGIVGQEHRLDWIEQIRRTQKDRKLFNIEYQLDPQQAFDKPATAPAGSGVAEGGVEVLSSPMKLSMPLLHENDLLNLINDLSGSVQAYLRLKRCTVLRAPQAAADNGPAAQLKADCDLDWITIRNSR